MKSQIPLIVFLLLITDKFHIYVEPKAFVSGGARMHTLGVILKEGNPYIG
jgi:hypothetical protein